MKRSIQRILLAVSLVAFAVPAAAAELEFNGYFRAGVGVNVRGGGQVCYGLANADTKWRLGNECDYVIEPQFTSRFVKLENKSAWGVVLMPGLYRTYGNLTGYSFSNLPAEFRQIYLFGENVPALLHGTIWGGRRYYDRLHLDINDQFLEIEDGDGAGVENMNVGVGKLSVAFLMNPNDESTSTATPPAPANGVPNVRTFKVTARLTDVATTANGALQIWLGYYGGSHSSIVSGTEAVPTPAPAEMVRFAVYHTLSGILGGSNLVGLKGEVGKNHTLGRAVLQETFFSAGLRTGFDFITEFRMKRDRADESSSWVNNNWFSIGARSDTQLAGPLRFLLEVGNDYVKPSGAEAQNLTKITGALAVSAGSEPGSRPTFRLFYTHGFWNKAAQEAGGVYDHWQSGERLKQVYGDKTSGGSLGIQAEAWW
jgi:maltoporin